MCKKLADLRRKREAIIDKYQEIDRKMMKLGVEIATLEKKGCKCAKS